MATRPEPADLPEDPDFDFHAYWQKELEHRAERRRRGELRDIPWDEAMASLEEARARHKNG